MAIVAANPPPAVDTGIQKFLLFRLGGEEYGIDILKVQEIRGCERVTRIPNVPDFMIGAINLRGVIVPIIDLRKRFHLTIHEDDSAAVVIILNLDHRVMGIVVDGVADVLSLTESQIRPTPDVPAAMTSPYLNGIGVVGKRMMALVNIDMLLSREEMQAEGAIAQTEADKAG